jgi:hypothetical protein
MTTISCTTFNVIKTEGGALAADPLEQGRQGA